MDLLVDLCLSVFLGTAVALSEPKLLLSFLWFAGIFALSAYFGHDRRGGEKIFCLFVSTQVLVNFCIFGFLGPKFALESWLLQSLASFPVLVAKPIAVSFVEPEVLLLLFVYFLALFSVLLLSVPVGLCAPNAALVRTAVS